MRYERPKIESVKIVDILSRLGPAHALVYLPGSPDGSSDDNSSDDSSD